MRRRKKKKIPVRDTFPCVYLWVITINLSVIFSTNFHTNIMSYKCQIVHV